MATNPPDAAGAANATVPVHQEVLHVGKRMVDTGRGVRVHKTVTEQPHTIDENLLHDTLEVKHVNVDKIVPLSEAPASRQEGDTYIVPVLEEVLVVEKRIRIKEEIHITRIARAKRHVDTVLLKSEAVSITPFDEGQGTPEQ